MIEATVVVFHIFEILYDFVNIALAFRIRMGPLPIFSVFDSEKLKVILEQLIQGKTREAMINDVHTLEYGPSLDEQQVKLYLNALHSLLTGDSIFLSSLANGTRSLSIKWLPLILSSSSLHCL